MLPVHAPFTWKWGNTWADQSNSIVFERPALDGQAEDLPSSTTPAPLTRANLRRLETMTGTKGSKSTTTAPSAQSKSDSKSISTTDAAFPARQRQNGGVNPLRSEYRPPKNVATINEFLDRSRSSASPTTSQHERFLEELDEAAAERDVEDILRSRVLQRPNQTPHLEAIKYRAKLDKQWIDFPKDVGFNNGLSAPKPDLTEGYIQSSFRPDIGQLGGSATLIKNTPNFIAFPHFAAEFKDFGKSLQQGEVQAGYEGAAMLYARNNALAAIGEPGAPFHASPVTVAADGHSWTAYTHYAAENEINKNLEYYQVSHNGLDITFALRASSRFVLLKSIG